MIKLIKALTSIRSELQDMNLKKSGSNTHMKFNYFELGDFLPAINKLEEKHGVCSIINFIEGYATLTLYSEENSIEIARCNTAEAGNKGMQPIQAEGAMQTYVRRYLYMMGYAIVENDWVDCVTNAPEETIDATKRKAMYAIAGVKGYKKEKVDSISEKKYGNKLAYITTEQYAEMYDGFKKLEDKK